MTAKSRDLTSDFSNTKHSSPCSTERISSLLKKLDDDDDDDGIHLI